jgi:heat-inducible transcriptional repressor
MEIFQGDGHLEGARHLRCYRRRLISKKTMNSRQELILGSIIREYVDSAVPVSSSLLVEKYDFGLSPATIRSEMLELESEGYLYQPHTSAGRIPTDKGFRYFVDVLMQEKELTKREQNSLQVEILKLKAQNKMLARTTAKLLSAMSGNLAVSGVIDSDDFYKSGIQKLLSQPEFSDLDSVSKIAEVIDYLDESMEELSGELKNKSEIEIYIGEENPISSISECSMVVSKYSMKNGEEGLLAIIGPKRMKYSRNVSLIDYLKKLLGEY